MTRQTLFGLGLTDRSPNVSAQRRQNLFLEIRPDGDRAHVVAYGTPGLTTPFVAFGDTPARGEHAIGDFAYFVHRGNFWQVNNAGVATLRGTLLTTTGRVYFADNGTIIMFVDGANGYTFNVVTNVYANVAFGFAISPNTVTWLDSYYIVDNNGTGKFFKSASNNPASWNVLDFATAEGSPDNTVRVFADHGELLIFGEVSLEPWGDSGAADFPFARIGSGLVEWGLAAPQSLVKFDTSIMFLGRNRLGESQVVILNGYTPQLVGSKDFLYALSQYTTVNDATALSYMMSGHPFYQINFPTANASWLYDGSTQAWSELKSDTGRHRANIGVLYLGKVIVSDYANGNIYRLDANTYTDNGAMIQREIQSMHIVGEDWMHISRLWVDMETGVGLTTGQGSDPQAMLQISKDGGHTWGNEIWRSFGKIGEYQRRVRWNRLGSSSKGFTFRLRITDPVKVAIMADGYLEAEA